MYRLGLILETHLKDFEGAIFNYEECNRLSTDRVSIYEVLKRIANIYFDYLQLSDKAIATYRRAMEFSPDSLELDFFQYRIARSYFRTNNFAQARIEYQSLLERFPKSQYGPKARFEIGNSYFMEGNYDTAIEALKKVLRQDGGSQTAEEGRYLMAQCLEQKERLSEAKSLYEGLLTSYPHPEVIKIRLEAIQKQMKQKK